MDSPRKETSYEEATNQYYAQEEYKKAMSMRDYERASRLRRELKEAGILVD